MGNVDKSVEPKQLRDINLLPYPLRMKCLGILSGLKAKGFHPILLETYRTPERQAWLYGYGRTHHIDSPVRTKVKDSKHCHKQAFDIGFKNDAGEIIWAGGYDGWIALRTLAEHWGLTSGGGWHMKDCPHVESK